MKPSHKLFIRKVMSRERGLDSEGKQVIIIKTVWDEVKEANIGSIAKPNINILEFEFVPIDDKEDKLQ